MKYSSVQSKDSETTGSNTDQLLNEVLSKNALKRATHPTSDFETLIHLLKGNIGTGLLSLPLASKGAGYIIGPLGIFVIGIIATHCMIMLVESANYLCKINNIPALDYSETMMVAVRQTFVNKPVIAKIAKYIVNVFLIITQFGFCSVYLVFVGDTLHQVMNETYCIQLDKIVWIAIIIVPVILFSWIRNLDHLSSLSALANISILFGIGVILYDEMYRFLAGNQSRSAAVLTQQLNWHGDLVHTALFFGNALFSYEAIGVVLPLENKMKYPDHAKRVIYSGMCVVVILYSSFGLIGYLVYGDSVLPSVTLNLCASSVPTSILFLLTKTLFAYSIFISYLLQFYVPMDFLQPSLHSILKLEYRIPRYHKVITTVIDLGFRTVLVLFTAGLAMSIPDLGDLLSLIGAVASSALALIFPSLIHLLTFWGYPNKKCLRCLPKPVWVIKDILIMMIGAIGLIFGTGAAIYNIVLYFEHKYSVDVCPPLSYCHLSPPY